MSERNITYLTNACLITCIVEMGSAEKVLEAAKNSGAQGATINYACLLYTSPSPRDATLSRMPSSA